MKEIYSFSIDVEKTVEKTVKKKVKNNQGKEVEKEEVVSSKETAPVKIIIKEPNRKELEEADIEYSIEMSKCIKRGIMTKAMLAKKYSDSGGLLSEEDAQTLTRLYSKLGDQQNRYTRLSSMPNKNKQQEKRAEELLGKMGQTRREIVDMETSYSSLFNHTADSKAQNKVLLWYMVHLSHYQENESDEIKPFFNAEDSEGKIDQYYEMDENGNELFDLAKDKIATVRSFWYYSANATKEDFDSLSEDFDAGTV